MSTQRNFAYNPYPEWNGKKKNPYKSSSSNNNTNTNNSNTNNNTHHTTNSDNNDNDSTNHRMNQHSLQQRGMFSSHRQSPSNTPERRSVYSNSNSISNGGGSGSSLVRNLYPFAGGNGTGMSNNNTSNTSNSNTHNHNGGTAAISGGNPMMNGNSNRNGNTNGNQSHDNYEYDPTLYNEMNQYHPDQRGPPERGGGPFTPPRSTSNYSNHSNQHQHHSSGSNNDQHSNHHEYASASAAASSSPSQMEKLPTPIITAKNARNFWKSKEEKPIKMWKKPNKLTTTNKNNNNSNNSHITNPTPTVTPVEVTNHSSSGDSVLHSPGSKHSVASSSGVFSNINSRGSGMGEGNGGNSGSSQSHSNSHSNSSSQDILQKNHQIKFRNKKNNRNHIHANNGGTTTYNTQSQQHHQHHQQQHVQNDDSWLSDENDSIQKKNRPEPKKLVQNHPFRSDHDHPQQQSQQSQKYHHSSNGYNQKRPIDYPTQRHHQHHQFHNSGGITNGNTTRGGIGGPGGSSSIQDDNHTVQSHNTIHTNNNNHVNNISHDGTYGEMQIKLDIAAAQLLTEEMKYKDLSEQYRKSQDEYETKIQILKHDLQLLKKEDIAVKDKYSSHMKELERSLNSSQKELRLLKQENEKMKREHQQQNDSKTEETSQQNEQLKELVNDQKKEIEELCMEVQRLHDNHRADSDISIHKRNTMEKEKNAEIASLKAQLLKEQKSNNGAGSSSSNNNALLEQQQLLLEKQQHDHRKLMEKVERLENELEAVEEDRDELLRRSTLYYNAAASEGNHNEEGNPKTTANSNIELQRIQNELKESKLLRQKQESRIQELENFLHNTKDIESIDLSAIDLENASYTLEKQHQQGGRFSSVEELSRVQKECTQYKRDAVDLTKKLNEVEKQREELKECLGEAMDKVEKLEDDQNKSKKRHEDFTEELMQIIKERDAEIEQLNENAKESSGAGGDNDVDVSDPLREELLNMVGWLNSSNRINGSPSIECMLTQDPTVYTEEMSEQPSDEFNNDDPALQSVYRHVKQLQTKLKKAQQEINRLNERKDCEEALDELSLEGAAERTCDEIWETLKTFEEIDNSTSAEIFMDGLRPLLERVAELMNSLKNHILALKKQIQMGNEDLQHEEDDEFGFGKLMKVSPFEMGKKDDEITQLKIIVGQLREELREKNEELSNGDFVEMPTPTKSNRSARKKKELESSAWDSVQPSNEEDDVRARMAQAELKRLKNDLKNKINAEETLKTIIRDHASRITSATAQAESLAQEKSELIGTMKELENKKIALEDDLNKAQHEISQLQQMIGNRHKEENTVNDEEVATLKTQLKMVAKERKKLKKSLSEAVEMLNSLQEHVLTAEKERKKMKKQLKQVLANGSLNKSADSKMSGSELAEDADQMENQSIILQLKSHIVALDHEISTLNDRIDELESLRQQNQSSSNDDKASLKLEAYADQIAELQNELKESRNVQERTKLLHEEVSAVNKELLNDLKATEIEEAETMEELEALKKRFTSTRREIDTAISFASSSLQKFQNVMEDSVDFASDPNQSIIEIIKRLDRCSDFLVQKNALTENALEEKNTMLLDLLSERQ